MAYLRKIIDWLVCVVGTHCVSVRWKLNWVYTFRYILLFSSGDNIKMDLKEIVWQDVDWFLLAQERD